MGALDDIPEDRLAGNAAAQETTNRLGSENVPEKTTTKKDRLP
jgi:hypothetical protein